MGYLSGQGKCYVASRDANGNALSFTFLGNVPQFELALSITTLEHKESTTGQRLIDLRLVTEKKVDLTINVQEFTPDNIALLAHGTVNTLASGSVTGELLGGGSTSVVVGQTFKLASPNVTSLVITDSAGSPATLSPSTDYSANLPYGMVTILNIGSFVQPFKAAYTKATGQKSADMFTIAPPIRWVRFLAVNTAQQNTDGTLKRFIVDLYNTQFDPAGTMGFITDTIADGQMKGSVLIDPFKSTTAVGGAIGQVTFIDA